MTTTEKAVIEALRQADAQVDGNLSKTEYRKLDKIPSVTTIAGVFGSWNEAKEAAGLETVAPPETDSQHNGLEYSYKDCVRAVQEVDERHEYQRLTAGIYEEYRDSDHPSKATIIAKIGGFPEVREIIL